MTNNHSQRGVAMLVVVAIIALVVVVGGGYYFGYDHGWEKAVSTDMTEGKMDETVVKPDGTVEKPSDAETMDGKEEGGAMIKKDGDAIVEKGGDEMMKDETIMKYSGVVLAGKSSPLLDFNKADYDSALTSNKLVVLYFYANWCPICKVEFPQAQAAFNELATDKVVGFRVNYKDSDTDSDEKALAVQFGIPYQHTKVLVKSGKQILKAPDSWNKMRYLDEINKAIAQ